MDANQLTSRLEALGFLPLDEEGVCLALTTPHGGVSVDFGAISRDRWIYHPPDRALITLIPPDGAPFSPAVRFFSDWYPLDQVEQKISDGLEILSR